MTKPTAYHTILDAADVVVRRDGSARLTLDAVAAEAGVSKGGLLYHFASKEALIEAMIARMNEQFQALHGAAVAADPAPPGAWTRAYARTMVGPERSPERNTRGAALLAAVALAPALLEPMRESYLRWRAAAVADGCAPEDAAIVTLAADGLWMADVLGLAAPQGEERRRIIERMLELAGG